MSQGCTNQTFRCGERKRPDVRGGGPAFRPSLISTRRRMNREGRIETWEALGAYLIAIGVALMKESPPQPLARCNVCQRESRDWVTRSAFLGPDVDTAPFDSDDLSFACANCSSKREAVNPEEGRSHWLD